MNKIRTFLFGLGRISSLLEKDKLRYHPCTHAGTLFNSSVRKNFVLQGIFDPNQERVESFLSDWRLDGQKIVTNLSLISKSQFDLAIIASSSNAHFENAIFAIRHGIKNLLIEKPICKNIQELRTLYKYKKKYNLNIWVNHERRYHPLYSYIREQLLNKTTGEIKTIRASVLTSSINPGTAFQTGGGPLLHDGTHAIDLIQWILKKPIKIKSLLEIKNFDQKKMSKLKNEFPVENRAIAMLEYKNKEIVFLEAGGERDYFLFEIDIQTERGRFVLSNDGHRIFVAQKSSLYSGFKSLKEIDLPKFPENKKNPWINLYKEIASVIHKKTSKITGSIEDNLEIFEIIQGIYSATDLH